MNICARATGCKDASLSTLKVFTTHLLHVSVYDIQLL